MIGGSSAVLHRLSALAQKDTKQEHTDDRVLDIFVSVTLGMDAKIINLTKKIVN